MHKATCSSADDLLFGVAFSFHGRSPSDRQNRAFLLALQMDQDLSRRPHRIHTERRQLLESMDVNRPSHVTVNVVPYEPQELQAEVL